MDEKGIEKFGTIHQTIWGDPTRVIKRIVEVSRTMIVARGAVDISTVPDPIESITNETGHVLCGVSSDGQKRWDVYIHNEERVGVKYARSIVEECERHDGVVSDAIIVSIEGPTPFTRRECEGKRVQFFLARDMCVNIVDHSLVPKHEAVAEPPPGVKVEELPRMELSDKIAQYYDWRPGQVVRITRVFGGHEPIPYYRVVVASGSG